MKGRELMDRVAALLAAGHNVKLEVELDDFDDVESFTIDATPAPAVILTSHTL